MEEADGMAHVEDQATQVGVGNGVCCLKLGEEEEACHTGGYGQ